ncbi:Type 1 glutamine amidotransferase-like domain-containing protein, partial [Patescibacteria group bacterium]|nr:Type 1 glutamine amidotransferase-like domain-containing protein [Patescibacteria group bacterium]
AELSDSIKIIKNKIEKSDLIYLPGGDNEILMQKLKKVANLIKNYDKVIIGNSAGALVLSKKYVHIEKQNSNIKLSMLQGLSLIDFSISVHYKSKRPNFPSRNEKEHKKLSEKTKLKIYAIPEQSALVYDNGNLKFIGKVKVFYKGKILKK